MGGDGPPVKHPLLMVGFQVQRQAFCAAQNVLDTVSVSTKMLPPCGVPDGTNTSPTPTPPPPPASLPSLLLSAQVTLSYGVFEGKLNVIKLHGPFSPEEDPSRWVCGLNL